MRLSCSILFAAVLAIGAGSAVFARDGASTDATATDPAGTDELHGEEVKPAELQGDSEVRSYLLAQAQKPVSPFEEIPLETPQTPSPFEDIEEEQPESRPGEDIIEEVSFRGTRRIPRDSLSARIFTKRGDLYEPQTLRRDFMVLWNTGYFDDLRLEIENGEQGKIVRFLVTERRVVRTIRYEGNKSATLSDILERFKERKVGLTVE